jgi:hypothetical protein
MQQFAYYKLLNFNIVEDLIEIQAFLVSILADRFEVFCVKHRNTPPTPSQEGRAERRNSAFRDSALYFTIHHSQFSILNSQFPQFFPHS